MHTTRHVERFLSDLNLKTCKLQRKRNNTITGGARPSVPFVKQQPDSNKTPARGLERQPCEIRQMSDRHQPHTKCPRLRLSVWSGEWILKESLFRTEGLSGHRFNFLTTFSSVSETLPPPHPHRPTLRSLGGTGRYQMLQLITISLGAFGASFQLLDNIFIGREITDHQCSPPSNDSLIPAKLHDVDWNSSLVKYGKCEIRIASNDTGDVQEHDCLFGHSYSYSRELSFRTEFDLVCDLTLLGGLAQSFVIMGQGVGAVIASIVSDRFGRKKVLVGSQFGLMAVGMAIGLSPSYAVLGTLKFLVGAIQQGVVTSSATLTTELFPVETRRLTSPVGSITWGVSSTGMALVAYLLRFHTWRYLQYTLSACSILFLFQLWYVDESLRWLVANGKKEGAIKVLERAVRANKKDLNDVLRTFETTALRDVQKEGKHTLQLTCPELEEMQAVDKDKSSSSNGQMTSPDIDEVEKKLAKKLEKSKTEKLSVFDIFRHKRLLLNAIIIWCAWFTCAFTFFALMMMSTTFVGNRFLNYSLISIMDLPSGLIFFLLVNRVGRKRMTQILYTFAGVGLLSSGIFRIFEDIPALATMSVVMAMLGNTGASGMFGAIFFYTPEIFPTNMRNQALGVASFAGRLGGMLAPFMTALSEIVVWAPGVMIGSLCFTVVFLFRFLPETQGKELPNTVGDIKAWYKPINDEKIIRSSNGDGKPVKTAAERY
ncbi:hypothetical protein BaRGS_00005141 [Batillaria attramentaria]|uniref:Major facilitator superfamily (MFS) profile domain-containing protein n=1 Tax=Batillaria attramentaria TaxID=370345 RepID=A0ABD0LW66_9CAEN